MLAYRAIDVLSEQNSEVKISHALLERVLKAFKTHRSTADIDVKWISDVVDTMKNTVLLQ